MSEPRRRIPTAVTLTIGLALGWGLANHRPPVVKATGGDRYGDYSLTSGPVAVQYNERTKTQATQDALYFLDYKGARLMAALPIQAGQVVDDQDGRAEGRGDRRRHRTAAEHAVVAVEGMLTDQGGEQAAHGGARHAQVARQLALGRQSAAGGVAAVAQAHAQLVEGAAVLDARFSGLPFPK